MPRRHALALAALLLTACAGVQPPAPVEGEARVVSTAERESQQIAELLEYYQRFAQLPAEDQRRELTAAGAEFNKDRSLYNRVRLGMLLAMPGVPFQDDARAAAVLGEPPTDKAGPLGQFAAVLAAHAGDRAKAKSRAEQADRRAEQADKRAEQADKRAEQSEKRAEAAERRAAEQREQLEALRAVERTLIERGRTPARK